MGHTTKGFLIALFSLFGSIILFINVSIWGETPLVTVNYGTDYYFGFNSLLTTFKALEKSLNIDWSNFTEGWRLVENALGLGLPQLLDTIVDFQAGAIDWHSLVDGIAMFIITLLLQPLIVIGGCLYLVACLLQLLASLVTVIFFALNGNFNSVVPSNPYDSAIHTMLIPSLKYLYY